MATLYEVITIFRNNIFENPLSAWLTSFDYLYCQVRDALRIDNNKLKHKAGLLGNKPLLKDYEVRKDEGEELQVSKPPL